MAAPELFYEVVSSRLDGQIGQIDALDGKVATAYGVAAGLVPAIGAFVAISNPPGIAVALYVAAIAVYLLLVLAVTAAYRVSDWSLRPDLETLQAHSATLSEETMRQWAAIECVLSIETNEPRIAAKATWVKASLILLAADALLLSAAAAFTA